MTETLSEELRAVIRTYPVKITAHYRSLIREKDDPVWRQCMPSEAELGPLQDALPDDGLGEIPQSPCPHLIHRYATLKLVPRPMTPDSTMTTLPVFARHDSLVSAACPPLPPCGPFLMAGHKKDIAVTNRLHTEPGRLFIYGWHYPDGRAIQPLSAAHGIGYVDYSHGVRLVRDEVLIDGRLHSLRAALQDPVLYALVSDEAGPMERTGYGE